MSQLEEKNVNLRVNDVSGHSMSHRNTLTAQVGTLVPILVEEVCPNTKCHLKTKFVVKMPPLASETFANIDYRIEAFFVPHRLLVNGFTDVACGRNRLLPESERTYIPMARFSAVSEANRTWLSENVFRKGYLADYLGYKTSVVPTGEYMNVNLLPFLAYHKIYDYWYRNKLIQKEVFRDTALSVSDVFAKYNRYNKTNHRITYDFSTAMVNNFTSNDGVPLWWLRQRNFDSDYFTTATASPQLGSANDISLPVANSKTALTISALRAANSLQQFAERNNMCGVDDVNYYRAMYGANLSYSVAQHPVLLGSSSTPIYVNGVFQTSPTSVAEGIERNPYMSVGAQYGSAYGNSLEVLINGFTAEEFGYIFVIGSLVPRVSYGTGVRRYLLHHIDENSLGGDLANPLLQNVGPQPIYYAELGDTTLTFDDTIDATPFGYQVRFSEWISHPDEVHGEFIDGNTLDSFVLQRSFPGSGKGAIGSEFLKIPFNYLDQIFAVSTTSSDSGFAYWVDMLHEWNIVSPIADFVVPSLQDPAYEHGHEVSVRKSGGPLV